MLLLALAPLSPGRLTQTMWVEVHKRCLSYLSEQFRLSEGNKRARSFVQAGGIRWDVHQRFGTKATVLKMDDAAIAPVVINVAAH